MGPTPTWEYGLRCLVQIARHRGKALSIPQIAKAEGLSSAYAGKLLNRLNKGGFIRANRGRNGGYILAKDPSAISLYEVFQALADSFLRFEDCESYSGALNECIHRIQNTCSILPVWRHLDLMIHRALSSLTLQDVIKENSNLGGSRQAFEKQAAISG